MSNYQSYAEWAADDPIGYSQHLAQQMDQARHQQAQAHQQQYAQQQRHQDINTVSQYIGELERNFSSKQKDYGKALETTRKQRVKQLKAAYPGATQDQLSQVMGAQEFSYAMQCLANGQDPAASAYNAAREGYGYGQEDEYYSRADRRAHGEDESTYDRWQRQQEDKETFAMEGEALLVDAVRERFGKREPFDHLMRDDVAEERFGTRPAQQDDSFALNEVVNDG